MCAPDPAVRMVWCDHMCLTRNLTVLHKHAHYAEQARCNSVLRCTTQEHAACSAAGAHREAMSVNDAPTSWRSRKGMRHDLRIAATAASAASAAMASCTQGPPTPSGSPQGPRGSVAPPAAPAPCSAHNSAAAAAAAALPPAPPTWRPSAAARRVSTRRSSASWAACRSARAHALA